jgi:DNA-directed RNA polymerase subunit RPC12/RpoP
MPSDEKAPGSRLEWRAWCPNCGSSLIALDEQEYYAEMIRNGDEYNCEECGYWPMRLQCREVGEWRAADDERAMG